MSSHSGIAGDRCSEASNLELEAGKVGDDFVRCE